MKSSLALQALLLPTYGIRLLVCGTRAGTSARFSCGASLVAAALVAAPAGAQPADYPAKPVQIVVALQAGSASDVAVRVLSERLAASLGQQFVVDNLPGAGGVLGANRVAKSSPDGYLLGAFNNGVFTILPHMGAKLPFDPAKDFAPVTMLAQIPSVLIVPPGSPANSVAELVALARQKPGELNYASVGNGSPQHIAMEMLKAATGAPLTHIPYKGGPQATLAVAAGEVQAFWIAVSVALPQIRAGKVRALAVGGTQRSDLLPEVPTMQQAGVASYHYAPWLGLYAPAGTPVPVIAKLNAEVRKVLAAADVKERLLKQGLEVRTSSIEELERVIREESVQMGKAIRDAGIRSE